MGDLRAVADLQRYLDPSEPWPPWGRCPTSAVAKDGVVVCCQVSVQLPVRILERVDEIGIICVRATSR
eukprot:7390082-Prymnesium_polylepis.2